MFCFAINCLKTLSILKFTRKNCIKKKKKKKRRITLGFINLTYYQFPAERNRFFCILKSTLHFSPPQKIRFNSVVFSQRTTHISCFFFWRQESRVFVLGSHYLPYLRSHCVICNIKALTVSSAPSSGLSLYRSRVPEPFTGSWPVFVTAKC